MSTLQRLIAAVGASTPERFNAEAMALAYYMVDHAADIAEREHLEASVVAAQEHYNLNDISLYEYRNVVDHLVGWLVQHAEPITDDVAHADDGAQT